MKITARIEQAKADEGTDALWLFIDRQERKTHVDDLRDILGVGERAEDEGNVAYAILASEVEAIRDACESWLEEESQRIMKESK
jgi:predicted flap endonuclease-1-like 5' DNA nuclease